MGDRSNEQGAETGINIPAKILIHGMNYAPELLGVGRYTGQLAEYLGAQGETVEVVTSVPHYPGWVIRQPYRSGRYYRELSDGITVIRCPLVLHPSGHGFWRLVAPLTFAITAAPVVVWRILRTRPNLVICVEPTLLSAPLAVLAAKIVGAGCLLYVQDLEIDAAFSIGHLRSQMLMRIAKWYERFVLRRFDSIITISQRMSHALFAKGVSPARLTVIRNWVDTSQIVRVDGPNYFRKSLQIKEDDFVALYAGQIGPKQALHFVLDAASACLDRSNIHFVIAGEGPSKDGLMNNYGHLPNVHFLPTQPENKLCDLLNLASLHILPQDRNAADLVLPSKLGGVLASGRPLLITADPETELHDLLDGVAIFVAPGDVDALAKAIKMANIERPQIAPQAAQVAKLFAKANALPAFHGVIRANLQRVSGSNHARKI